ncbi:MAG TPA: hypothetical protein VFZ89_10520 [Solirubrobacteraceae bacterium]
MTSKTKRITAAIIVTGGIGLGATAIATAGGDDDGSETPITGAALQDASAAALAHTGGGRVTETERGDEESLYEVEVTRPDGSRVDVQLDRDFKVVGEKVESGRDDD